jgi:hypothetical protein
MTKRSDVAQVLIRLPVGLKQQLAKLARQSRRSANAQAIVALEEHLRREGAKKGGRV